MLRLSCIFWPVWIHAYPMNCLLKNLTTSLPCCLAFFGLSGACARASANHNACGQGFGDMEAL